MRFSVFSFSCSACYPFPVLSDSEVFFTKFGCCVEPVYLQNFHILIHLLVRHLCVKLCGGNRHVPHHTADCFYRNAERERDMGPEIMPGHVEGQIETVHIPQFPCQHDKISPAIKIEHLVSLPLVTVFLNNPQRYIQQADRGRRICLLPAYMNPPRTVIGSCDITRSQPFQVRVSQPRERRKKHQSKGDRNKENQTQLVVNKRFYSRLPLQPNSKERQDNARFPLPSHYLFRCSLRAEKQRS